MTHNLIHTDKYLLMVDDQEVRKVQWYLDDANQVRKVIMGEGLYWAVRSGYKHITAHLPLNGAPVLEGVPLLPPEGYIEGYTAAKEKYKYTEEDMLGFTKWLSEQYHWNWYYKVYTRSFVTTEKEASNLGFTLKQLFDIWHNSHQPSLPKAFECEMESIVTGHDGNHNIFGSTIKTTTNSQGQTVLVGKYIY